MRDKETNQVESLNQPEARPYVEMPTLGRLFKRNGVYDGKLFHSRDKVTYTFVDGEEVVTLHFDKSRKAIFHKGHNIDNLTLTDIQWAQLEQFPAVMESDDHARDFISAYKKVLQAYLKEHPRSASPE